MNIKLDHINLTTSNLGVSIDWYEKIFDFKFKEGNLKDPKEPWAIIGKDDMAICLYEDKSLDSAAETVSNFHRIYHFGIRVSDRVEWEEILQTHKLPVMFGGAYQYPRSVSWYILDPSGHEIEVSYSANEPLKFE